MTEVGFDHHVFLVEQPYQVGGVRFEPSFLACFHCRHRFANAVPSTVKFAEVRIGPRQT